VTLLSQAPPVSEGPSFIQQIGNYLMSDTPVKNHVEQIRIGTGCTTLDLNVGGAAGALGLPAGKIVNIVGDSSSFKTFLCCEIIASAYHKYGKRLRWVYDDCESGFTFNTTELYGFEIIPEDKGNSSQTVQEMSGNVRKFISSLKKDEFGIYVVDSLDGLSSEEIEQIAKDRQSAFEKGKEYKKGSYQMESAKFLSQEFFRTLTDDIQNKNVLLIFVSQIRHNIDVTSFQKWTRAGGKALDFYAYCCLWLKNIKKIIHVGKTVGVVVEAESKKLKAPRPFRVSRFVAYFDYGIDDIGTNLDFLFDLRGKKGELLKSATSIEWEGNTYDRADLIGAFEDGTFDPATLRNAVIQKWEAEEEAAQSHRPSKYAKKVINESHKESGPEVNSERDSTNTAPVKRRGRPPKKTETETNETVAPEEEDFDE
jgi:RecA/RadA recombinase